MARHDPTRLRLLAAELRAECPRIELTIAEAGEAHERLTEPDSPRLFLYAAAALLETFYTGVEKAVSRTAAVLGGLPAGAGWHRQLLTDATLDLPKVRPPILTEATARALERYLAFRHRFRNLYLFDLDQTLILPLLAEAPAVCTAAITELRAFADALDGIANAIDIGSSRSDDSGPSVAADDIRS